MAEEPIELPLVGRPDRPRVVSARSREPERLSSLSEWGTLDLDANAGPSSVHEGARTVHVCFDSCDRRPEMEDVRDETSSHQRMGTREAVEMLRHDVRPGNADAEVRMSIGAEGWVASNST